MKQPDIKAQAEYNNIVNNSVSRVRINGTRRTVKLRWIKPYTMERITRVWIERDLAAAKLDGGPDVLKDLAKEPYFAFKEAALIILNNDIKIRLFYWLYWRWLAFRYNETQIVDIIAEGKKKLPLMAHYETMAYSLDMRTDIMRMTKMEAEQYRAELLSEAKRRSSKTFRSMEGQGSGSEDGNVISDTDVS